MYLACGVWFIVPVFSVFAQQTNHITLKLKTSLIDVFEMKEIEFAKEHNTIIMSLVLGGAQVSEELLRARQEPQLLATRTTAIRHNRTILEW